MDLEQTWRTRRSRPRWRWGSHGLDPKTRETTLVEGEAAGHVQWSICSVNRPWRSRSRRRRGDSNGLDPVTRDGRRWGKEPQPVYTGHFVQSRRPWRSRPRHPREESRPERAGSRDLGRGGNRGSRRQELVTIGVQTMAPLLDLGGANRIRGWRRKGSEKAENQGSSWRKPPRQESLRPRNSSGSLTS